MRSWWERKFRSPELALDPRGEPPNPDPGVFDECFNPVLSWKRATWRRWQKLGRMQRIYELIWWRLYRAGQWAWWLIRYQCKPPGFGDSPFILPMVSARFPQLRVEDIVVVQPMAEPVEMEVDVVYSLDGGNGKLPERRK